jgi:hypothetical protein
VEGLAFLVVTLVVVAALTVGLASARRQITEQHGATATALRQIAGQLDGSDTNATGQPSTTSLVVARQPRGVTGWDPGIPDQESRPESLRRTASYPGESQ